MLHHLPHQLLKFSAFLSLTINKSLHANEKSSMHTQTPRQLSTEGRKPKIYQYQRSQSRYQTDERSFICFTTLP